MPSMSGDFLRYFNAAAAIVSAVFIAVILWRDTHATLFDYWGKPIRVTNAQKGARAVFCGVLFYLAYVSIDSIRLNIPLSLKTAMVTFLVTGAIITTVAWFRNTKSRRAQRKELAESKDYELHERETDERRGNA